MIWLLACATDLEPDAACKEVGFAIASRTQECTADGDLAESRYLAFDEAYTCVEYAPTDTAVPYQDLYACPLAIRNLACELVDSYGDDLDAWLTASPACPLLVEPA